LRCISERTCYRSLARRFQLQVFYHFSKQAVGFVTLRFRLLNVLAQGVETSLLLVQLACITQQEGLLFGTAAEGFHVFAQAALIVDDALDVLLTILHFFLEPGDDRFLRGDTGQGLLHSRRNRFLADKQSNLVIVEVDELIGRFLYVRLFDGKRGGGFGGNLQAEAVDAWSLLLGLAEGGAGGVPELDILESWSSV